MISVPTAVKDALKSGDLPKNYRINVLNNDGTINFTIDNNTLVSESVKLDERMCSGDVLKFGLCEGSSLEFQYFNHPTITGRRIQVFVDVYCSDNYWDYVSIPMGFYIVDGCSRQASTNIRKATAYNKLMSDYLDKKANSMIMNAFDNPNNPISFYDIRNVLLDNYEVEINDYAKVAISPSINGMGTVRKLSGNALNLKAKYGIESPFNYYSYRGGNTSANLTGYLFVVAAESKCELDTNSVYKISSDCDLEQLERSFYDEIQRLMELSFNVTGNYMSRFLNAQTQSAAGYDPYLGWHNFFGICLEKSNGTKVWYSTIAYNAGLNNVVGTFKDLKNTTIKDCKNIYFYIPAQIYFSANAANTNGDICVAKLYKPLSDPKWTFLYYTTSSYNYRTGTYLFLDYQNEAHSEDWILTGWANVYKYNNMSSADLTSVTPSQLPEITLRDAISAAYETVCEFGKLDRATDLFSGVPLSQGAPHETITKDMYSKLWADEDNVRKWRYLIITYKGLENGQEKQLTLQRTINADGTDDYNMSNNWLFNNLVWTAEQVGAYADVMVTKMQNITWFPFEEWGAGLPYVETGDKVGITFGNQIYDSYVLQRQLNGIQNLQDTYINGTLDIF